MKRLIRIREEDNVAVAIEAVCGGEEMYLADREGIVTAAEAIPQGHKAAVQPIRKGETVIKYGTPIGEATEDIQPGFWIHTHNMKTRLSAGEAHIYRGTAAPPAFQRREETFLGFRRPDGKVGVRNEIWIIPAVGCVNDVARRLASENQDLARGSIEGLYAFAHPYGCSQTGSDHRQTRKILAALARHPNAAAVLILHLGCENLTAEQFRAELGEFDPRRVKFMVCQDEEDEMAAGRALLRECAAYAAGFCREAVSADSLVVGLKCGGSDGLSGITANPVVGRCSDALIACGGTAVLTEVPEMFGAEDMLLSRCRDRQTFQKAAEMIEAFKAYFLSHGEVIYENPSPGNKAGGITTLEEKSCGCVQKGGTMPVADVLAYGDQVRERGLNLLSGPGNDLVSATALTAAGAHLILFTTGRGTPFGAPAPTVKIASNSQLAEKKKNWIDFSAAAAAAGEPLETTAERLFQLVLETASGKPTKSEIAGFRQIAVFKDGVTL